MNLALWLRYGLKNLRSGLQGFWIFLACLILGVASIAIVGSLGAAIDRGLSEQGQPLLGGDMEFSLIQRDADAKERSYIEAQGRTSRIATLRAMASTKDATALVEVKAVDQAYPLFGAVTLSPPMTARDIYGNTNGTFGITVDPLLLGRLHVKIGDLIKIGEARYQIRSTITNEPDRIADGFVLGPRVMMSHEALAVSKLIQPGSLITWKYRVKLPGDPSLATVKAEVDAAEKAFPDSGWRIRARDNAANGAERFVERLQYFLTLVGIAALVVGGAGIANAVRAFMDRRQRSIATFKCLGLSTTDITGMVLAEITAVALLGITIGLSAGAIAPWLLSVTFGSIIPLPIATSIAWGPLAFAGLLGFLVTLAFALWPLARITRISGTALFRASVAGTRFQLSWPHVTASALCIAAAAGLTLLWFENSRITAIYLAGLGASFAGLALLSYLLLKAVSLLPRPANVMARHAMANLVRPGAASLPVIMALGLGLGLFVTLALTDGTISKELRSGLSDKAPAFFFLDVPNADLEAFARDLSNEPGAGTIANAPMLRGRIVKVKGVAAADVKVAPEAAWALRGDRGLTYATELPSGSELVEGQWWPKDYAGPPLVSLVEDIAKGLDLKIGDKITVNALGRDVEARVASLRRVNWRSMGINFVMVFSPEPLRRAPHSHLVTLQMDGGDEARLLNAIAASHPSVTAIRVKEALALVSDLMAKMLAAVRAANGLTLLTGVLVLAGALSASLSTRSFEAVVLKTYGATRKQLLQSLMIEYGLLGLIAAGFGIAVGSAGAWYISRFILELPFAFSWPVATATALLAMVLAVGAGLLTTHRALSAKPSAYLRNE